MVFYYFKNLFCAGCRKCWIQLLLEDRELLSAVNGIGLGLAVDGIGDDKEWRAGNAGGLRIREVLIRLVLVFVIGIA